MTAFRFVRLPHLFTFTLGALWLTGVLFFQFDFGLPPRLLQGVMTGVSVDALVFCSLAIVTRFILCLLNEHELVASLRAARDAAWRCSVWTGVWLVLQVGHWRFTSDLAQVGLTTSSPPPLLLPDPSALLLAPACGMLLVLALLWGHRQKLASYRRQQIQTK